MRLIPLSRGLFAKVSDVDFERLNQHKWYATSASRPYAVRNARGDDGRWRRVWMHREVMGDPPGLMVDHRHGDTLDNRRSQLRVATARQNNINRRVARADAPYRGVRQTPGGWQARHRVGGRMVNLGVFPTAKAAALAYDASALAQHGEWAVLNFPPDRERKARKGPPRKAAAVVDPGLSMAATAALCDVSADQLRGCWLRWVEREGFPLPFRYPSPGRRGVYAWRRSAVVAWLEARAAVSPPRP